MLWKQMKKSFVLLVVTFVAIITTALASDTYKENKNVIYKNIIAEVQVITYTWTIENLHLNNYTNGQALISPAFGVEMNETTDKYHWYLKLYPKGAIGATDDDVSLYLYIVPRSNISANIQFGLKIDNNEFYLDKSFFYRFGTEVSRGSRDFISNATNKLIANSTLKIFCKIETTIATSQDPTNGSFKNDLGKDLTFLLDNELFSDIKISTNGKDFSAHKAILAARCPFFKDLFEYDAQVKNTSRVNMTDMDQEVVKEMLRYIYTNGDVSNLADLTPNLLIAAEKCQWVNLKASCENSISSQLSVENAVEYFKLGDEYFAPDLKNKAKDYIVAHATDIISTNEFRSLIGTHPLLVEEIFSALIKKLPKN